MNFSIKIKLDLGIKEIYQDIKQFVNKQICKRKGHDWKKYVADGSYFCHLLLYRGKDIEKTCKRCGETVYKKEKKPKTVKFRRYRKLKAPKSKKKGKKK